MPNWCRNTVKIEGDPDRMGALLEAAWGNDERRFSLQKLVPCPQSLRDAVSGTEEMGYDILYGPEEKWQKVADYPWVRRANKNKAPKTREECAAILTKLRPAIMEKAALYKKNLEEYGYTTWYDWCIDHWGTKWDLRVKRLVRGKQDVWFQFESAWSPPLQALLNISVQFPELTFSIQYEEEAMGLLGAATFQGGSQTDG